MTLRLLISGALIITMFSCKNDVQDLSVLPTYTEEGALKAVIEIPAGTNKKIEYNKKSLSFEVDILDNKERRINFLPYPANYGFIPSTLCHKAQGGDGDPLDVIVISETVPSGTLMDVTPIGVLRIVDDGEEDDKIIAVPANRSQRIIDVDNYNDWSTQFGASKMILLTWFRSYNPSDDTQIIGFRNEHTAKQLIQKWQIKS